MVKYSERNLDLVFGALSDPTRRHILERLSRGEAAVTELAEPFSSSLPAVSKHLKVLENAGLIRRQPVGRNRICRITPAAMESAANWIDIYRQFWTVRLDALDEMLRSEQENNE